MEKIFSDNSMSIGRTPLVRLNRDVWRQQAGLPEGAATDWP